MERDRAPVEAVRAVLEQTPGLAPADAQRLADELVSHHAEPHRRYHTIRHLSEVLSAIDELSLLAEDIHAVELAAIYHDAVYDPLADDNEQRSAVLARDRLGDAGVDPPTVHEVARLVELTASHDVATDDMNGSVLIDADLAILASAPARYDEYRDQVRQEYPDFDDATYASGRRRVLEAFTSRPAIFRTALRRAEREAAARANLERELADLGTD